MTESRFIYRVKTGYVLRPFRVYLDTFETLEEARAARSEAIKDGRIKLLHTITCVDCGIKVTLRRTASWFRQKRCTKCARKKKRLSTEDIESTHDNV